MLLRLGCGLWLFGVGEALLVASGLGNSPWTVLSEGVSRQTPLSIGEATILISLTAMLLWIPLRQRPGTRHGRQRDRDRRLRSMPRWR